ncbi:hypothetical protein CRENBAI_002440 [Crenichthys baileyi]|uniref:Uncharacterized protein n=1 Tax=Crenichthys baileyi TaxID=28760 RepID=A0AAV9QYM6_9TELE
MEENMDESQSQKERNLVERGTGRYKSTESGPQIHRRKGSRGEICFSSAVIHHAMITQTHTCV